MKLIDVELLDDCLLFEMTVFLHDEDMEVVVDTAQLMLTFPRVTIALVYTSEDWWDRMEQSALFERLWEIAVHSGCLVELSAADKNSARVWGTELDKLLEGKNVMSAHETLQ